MPWRSGYILKISDKTRELTAKTIKIGRGTADASSDDTCILLPDELVSRHHATLKWQFLKQCYLLVHKSKTNPTLVNGEPSNRILLAPGDKIQVGHTTLFVARREDQVKTTKQLTFSARPSAEVLLELHKLASKISAEVTEEVEYPQGTPKEEKPPKLKTSDFKWAPPEERK